MSFSQDNPTNTKLRNDQRTNSSSSRRAFTLPSISLPENKTTRILPRGFPGGLAYEKNTDLVHYSDGTGWFPLTGTQTSTFNGAGYVIWQPFGTPNEYTGTNWGEVYSRLQALPQTRKFVIFDIIEILNNISSIPTGTTPFVIPSGNYDVYYLTFYYDQDDTRPSYDPGSEGIRVLVEDGVKLNGLRQIKGLIQIEYQGTTPATPLSPRNTGACVDIDVAFGPDYQGNTFLLRTGANIKCTGTAPFVEFFSSEPSEVNGVFVFQENSRLDTDNTSCVRIFQDTNLGSCPSLGVVLFSGFLGSDTISTIRTDGSNTITVPNVILQFFYRNPFQFNTSLPVVPTTRFPNVDGINVFFNRKTGNLSSTRMNRSPTPTDDSEVAVEVGDIWIDLSAGNQIYMCVDSSPGSAVWTAL